jgi:hypothetical protein
VIDKIEGAPKRMHRGYGQQYRNTVLTLVTCGGSARSFHVGGKAIGQLIPIIRANVAAEAKVITDAASWYKLMNKDGVFASHERVDHAEGEYVRDGHIHTNTVEGYYSIFKRGMKGVYRHCREKHLHRYLAEFDFRYSNRSSLGIEDCERGACRKGRGWQASHVSGTSLSRT